MRGWSYNTQGLPAEVLKLSKTLKEPQPTSVTPIIVKVHAMALNPDSSVLMKILPEFILRRKLRIPEIDFAGIVAEVNQTESRIIVGDQVFGHIPPIRHVTENIGVLAEKVAVSPDWIIPKPVKLTYEEAAALPTSFVSAYKLASGVRNGSRVLVNGGSGGIGLTLVQLLKKWKQADVTTTASNQSWHIVEEQHPDTIVNYREVGDLASHLHKQFQPFDYAIDLVGDSSLLKQSHRYLAKDGVFVAFGGGLSSESVWGFLSWLFKTLAIGLLPIWLGGSGRKFRFVAVAKESDSIDNLCMLDDFYKKGWVRPCIDSIHDFEEVLAAYDRLSSRRADGKVVIRMPHDDGTSTSPPFPT